MGLRERKRRATTNAIERAAVSLALAHGMRGVTVEQICAAADVSRSTFFNYFPTLQSAIIGPTIQLPEPAAATALLDGLAEREALPIAVMQLGLALLGAVEVNAEVGRLRQRLVAGDPELKAAFAGRIAGLQDEFAAVVEGWLAAHPERRALPETTPRDESVAVVAAAFAAGTVLAEELYAGQGDRVPTDADLREALDLVARAAASG